MGLLALISGHEVDLPWNISIAPSLEVTQLAATTLLGECVACRTLIETWLRRSAVPGWVSCTSTWRACSLEPSGPGSVGLPPAG